MTHRIFLSHNHHDKPIVEAVAQKLATIFGQDQVFYDSWSIRPGDGIIDMMNKGLGTSEFVFLFVSACSLASSMVQLEWQNALYSAINNETRLIPIRIDDSDMPPVLRQILFIDMYTMGPEATIDKIVGLIQGDELFTPQYQNFSNLTYSLAKLENGSVEITVRASHMMEAHPNFAFPVMNENDEIGWWIKGHSAIEGCFRKNAFQLNEGGFANAVVMRPFNSSLTPSHPLTFLLIKRTGKAINLIDVLHEQEQDLWVQVPPTSQRQA